MINKYLQPHFGVKVCSDDYEFVQMERRIGRHNVYFRKEQHYKTEFSWISIPKPYGQEVFTQAKTDNFSEYYRYSQMAMG